MPENHKQPERGFKQLACEILDISTRSYSNFSKQKRLIIHLLEKYFKKEDLEEFIETGKILRLEDNKDQELLNNEASKIYNHFISALYLKDKSLLKLFLVVINNANETSANLNLNFIDLVFQTEGNEKDKINLLKEFNKTAQNNNILFFYSIKFMIQNKFENILYAFGDIKIAKDLSFIVNYIQFFLEIFYKKDYIKWQEFEKNESIHLRDYEFNLDDEIFLDEQSDSPLPSLDDLSDENKIPNYDYDDYYNEYEEESNNYDNFNYFKFIDSLKNYKTYLESLIPENDTILVKFKIDENPDIDLEELLTIKNSFDI